MYRRFHDRFGTAGLVVAVIALIAALAGTAIAAGGLTKSQEKQVKKIAKKYAGKPGPAGPQGLPGANGKDGTNGTNGKDGTNGTNGTNGKDGQSVEAIEFGPTEEEELGFPCGELGKERGGSEFKSASPEPTYACNGAEGSPWTAGGTLPEGKTETGEWTISDEGATVFGFTLAWESISFPIPLEAGLPSTAAHVVTAEEQENEEVEANNPDCVVGGVEGTASNPVAAPGNLCVFIAVLIGASENPSVQSSFSEGGTGRTGAFLNFLNPAAEGVLGFGTFAVTAPITP